MMILVWPLAPYTRADLPPALADELESLLEPLYVATLALHRLVYRHELQRAIGRDRDFVPRINGTTAAPPLTTIRGCLAESVVGGLCSFFDEDADAVDLRAILNCVLRPEYADRFCEFHTITGAGLDVSRQRARLGRMQRRIRRGHVARAIGRLRDLRNQLVAHLDTRPEFAKGRPVMSDMDVVLGAVANIVVSVGRLVITGRQIVPAIARRDARLQARAFCLAIQPVASTSAHHLPAISGRLR